MLFHLTESEDKGMHKFFQWTNNEMHLLLTNDRGYYDCELVPHKKPINPMDLIRLLRFLKNDKVFYKMELIKANRSYTLTINEYVELLYKNYEIIKNFLATFDQSKYDNYETFDFSVDGI
jgi:hypothetical protein